MGYKDPDKQRKYGRDWLQKRRAKWLAENGPCRRCESWYQLRVDHVDPKTKVDHKVWSWSEPRRLAELAKCQVLCHECHKKKTVENQENARGEQMANAVLTERIVREIRVRVAAGEQQASLAREFGVNKTTVGAVVHRKKWRHVL